MGENYFLRQGEFIELLRLLTSDYDIFTLARQNGSLSYQRFSPPDSEVVTGGVRAVDPLKSFFFPARELVSLGYSHEAGANGRRPKCIVGAKSCDLKAANGSVPNPDPGQALGSNRRRFQRPGPVSPPE